ncbi:MAG: hypothetical protein LUD44_06075 [Firmicutes bacterium]|nr:hypothetical protein [Bacillota bacterium]
MAHRLSSPTAIPERKAALFYMLTLTAPRINTIRDGRFSQYAYTFTYRSRLVYLKCLDFFSRGV